MTVNMCLTQITFLKSHLNIESDDVLFPAALIQILETIFIGAGSHLPIDVLGAYMCYLHADQVTR